MGWRCVSVVTLWSIVMAVKIKPRGWQIEALNKFKISSEKFFLLDGTPGCGKTMFGAFCADYENSRGANFDIIVVPTTAIKGDKDAGFLGDWNRAGIQITTVLKESRGIPQEYRGAVITYQQLPNLISTFEAWARAGRHLFTCFDEIHHACDDNVWGEASEALWRCSRRVLAETGTCFRGDRRRISFVKYDADGKAIADYRYSYRQAVTDHVCRPVEFVTDDSMTQFMLDDENHEVRISEGQTQDDLLGASQAVFRSDREFLRRLIEKADDTLDQYRSWDHDAGGLVICRPGRDEHDNRHLHQVADLMQKTLGERPEVISYDDTDANAKIERFRKSGQRWVCSVRKITEGVDIKRLRVEVMATRPQTELLFRQIVGRVVRVDDDKRPGNATVYIAKFPQLVEWAKTIAEEAKAGLRQSQDGGTDSGLPGGDPRKFMSFGATHEDGGAVSDFGEQYTIDEVNAAERLRGADPQLVDLPITTLAYLNRKLGIIPEPMAAPEPPLQVKKKGVRTAIVKKARHLAIKRNPSAPDFKQVWKDIGVMFGPFNADDMVDNYSIEVMRQIDAWLLATIGAESHVA